MASARLLALYHRLPPAARSIAATLHGAYLRAWRYGSSSPALIEAAIERENWSPERWRTWREDRLAAILHRAATRVPYYERQWSARRRNGDRASWEMLENWPVLEKAALRAEPRAFLADDCDPARMFHEQTSGTTGTPLEIWRSKTTMRELYALAITRTRGWHRVPRDVRWARLGGQLVTPTARRRPPFWVWNAAMRQLYLSSHHLAPDLVPYYLDALAKYRIRYLAGYPSSLAVLAQAVLAAGRDDLPMLAVITNAEPLTRSQRDAIGRAFHCSVRETYGMAETVAFGSECPDGTLHQWPEVGIIETMDRETDELDSAAEFVCTGLLNPDMPLVRYRVGDRGRLAPHGGTCSCGRTLPVIDRIEGRAADLLITRDGRLVFWINPVFYGLPIRESQVVQESLSRVLVRIAPAAGFTSASGRTIVERLKDRLGDVEVKIESVDSVPRTSAGKLRPVVCAVDPAERARALQPVRAGTG